MTAFAVISDVHANLEALETVLREIEKENVDEILFLGDAAGYGPDPNECIDLLRKTASRMIAGNHDHAAVNLQETSHFNPFAKAAAEWTHRTLTEENIEFLRSLPLTDTIEEDNIFLVHGTPKEPEAWHYFMSEYDAEENLGYFDEKICFLGHSHSPFIAAWSDRIGATTFYGSARISANQRFIVNAGSVGQPRDANPYAAYVLCRDDAIEIKRVPYDIVVTQNRMEKHGLPAHLIERLSLGR